MHSTLCSLFSTPYSLLFCSTYCSTLLAALLSSLLYSTTFSALYSLFSALYSLFSTLCAVLCNLCSMLSARYSLLSALCSRLSTLCSLLSVLYSLLSALCSLLFSMTRESQSMNRVTKKRRKNTLLVNEIAHVKSSKRDIDKSYESSVLDVVDFLYSRRPHWSWHRILRLSRWSWPLFPKTTEQVRDAVSSVHQSWVWWNDMIQVKYLTEKRRSTDATRVRHDKWLPIFILK